MPVEIRHGGGDFGALAGLALLLGQMQAPQQAPQAPQMRDLIGTAPKGGGRGIGGGGGSQRRARPKIRESGRMDEYNRMMLERKLEHQKMQEEQRLKEQGWKYQYSTRARHEAAKINDADRIVSGDPRFSEADRRTWAFMSAQKRAGIASPKLVPPDPNELQFEPGQEPGKLWEHEGTSAVMRTVVKDGMPISELVVRPDQTIQYKQMELKAAQEEARMDAEAALNKELRAARFKLATEEIPVWGKDSKGARTKTGTRRRTMGELNADMHALYPWIRQELDPSQQQQPILEVPGEVEGGRQPPPQAPSPLDRAMAQGMKITEADKKLPGNVGAAQAYLRWLQKRYKGRVDDIPQDELEMAMEADRAIREHRGR